jgi:hypothetical protein
MAAVPCLGRRNNIPAREGIIKYDRNVFVYTLRLSLSQVPLLQALAKVVDIEALR